MKQLQVTIPWREGLHLRPAARLAAVAKVSRSSIWLKANGKMADAKSILALLLLAGAFGMVVDLEVAGEDEEAAIAAITRVFSVQLED